MECVLALQTCSVTRFTYTNAISRLRIMAAPVAAAPVAIAPFTTDIYVQLCTELLRSHSQTHPEAAQRLLPLAQCIHDWCCRDLRLVSRAIRHVHQHWTRTQADEIAQLHAQRDQLHRNREREDKAVQQQRLQLDLTAQTETSQGLMQRLASAEASLSDLELQCTNARRQITAALHRWERRWQAGLLLEPAVVQQCVAVLEQMTRRTTPDWEEPAVLQRYAQRARDHADDEHSLPAATPADEGSNSDPDTVD